MFRNNNTRTQTQSQTIPNTFTGGHNTLGSNTQTNSNSNTNSNYSNSTDDEIIFGIVTGNLNTVKRLVNSSNVNKVIDRKNNYTALHHAVRIKKNDSIIEYLMSVGANPSIKESEGKDSIDLSIDTSNRFLIDKLIKEKEAEIDKIYTKFDDVNYKMKNLERSNQDLVKTNEYLTKSNEQYAGKIEELKVENATLKRKYESSEQAFANLLKKTKKN